jgi:hypothetical protein
MKQHSLKESKFGSVAQIKAQGDVAVRICWTETYCRILTVTAVILMLILLHYLHIDANLLPVAGAIALIPKK